VSCVVTRVRGGSPRYGEPSRLERCNCLSPLAIRTWGRAFMRITSAVDANANRPSSAPSSGAELAAQM